MPEFERRTHLRRQLLQERVEQRQVLLGVRWQLEEERAQLILECASNGTEPSDQIAAVSETAVVRNAPGSFQREFERPRSLRRPATHELLVRHPIERVVDLDGWEPRRVVRQHLRSWQIRWIEA